MAKLYVTDSADGTRVPFLRGVLTGSLSDAGLVFEQAYKLASDIRDELSEKDEISTVELRKLVVGRLGTVADEAVVTAYQMGGRSPDAIMVRDAEGQKNAFSRFQLQRSLESCGLTMDESSAATGQVFRHLVEKHTGEISSSEIGHITYDCLVKHMGEAKARRYLVWREFTHSGRPLLLMFGGTTGCGKSTIATEIAHRLGIVRTQSTDMLREVMRMMIPERLMPVIHTSSFYAWTVLPAPGDFQADPEGVIAEGYLSQTESLSVPCEAVTQRALRERVSLILEGVHMHPSLLDKIIGETDAIVVPVMLAVLKEKQLRRRLRGRLDVAPARAAEAHLEHFDAIWRLQSYLLSEADKAGIPIINNDRKEATIQLCVEAIMDALFEHFSTKPDLVFQ
ncbi:MAG: ATP cone domain-containing protein [Candidatus Sedimenticola sp. 20ELBAFRAG]